MLVKQLSLVATEESAPRLPQSTASVQEVIRPSKTKKPETEEQETRRMAVGVFRSVNTWGVKDRNGEWLTGFTRKCYALKVWETDPAAYELYKDLDAWDCLLPEDEQKNPQTLVERKK